MKTALSLAACTVLGLGVGMDYQGIAAHSSTMADQVFFVLLTAGVGIPVAFTRKMRVGHLIAGIACTMSAFHWISGGL